nr:MAG TPA: hypothetical protein [Caudoviricetes sp.]
MRARGKGVVPSPRRGLGRYGGLRFKERFKV